MNLDDLSQLSPPVALAVLLYFTGSALKRSPLENWLIPFLLPLLGAVLYPLISETAKVSYAVRNPLVFNAVIGAVIGSAATGLDQQIRQWLSRKDDAGATRFITKSHDQKPPPTTPPPPAP